MTDIIERLATFLTAHPARREQIIDGLQKLRVLMDIGRTVRDHVPKASTLAEHIDRDVYDRYYGMLLSKQDDFHAVMMRQMANAAKTCGFKFVTVRQFIDDVNERNEIACAECILCDCQNIIDKLIKRAKLIADERIAEMSDVVLVNMVDYLIMATPHVAPAPPRFTPRKCLIEGSIIIANAVLMATCCIMCVWEVHVCPQVPMPTVIDLGWLVWIYVAAILLWMSYFVIRLKFDVNNRILLIIALVLFVGICFMLATIKVVMMCMENVNAMLIVTIATTIAQIAYLCVQY